MSSHNPILRSNRSLVFMSTFVAAPTRPEIAPGRPIFQAASIQRILRPPQHQFYPINWANSMVHPFWLKLDELTWRLIAMALLTHAITPAPFSRC